MKKLERISTLRKLYATQVSYACLILIGCAFITLSALVRIPFLSGALHPAKLGNYNAWAYAEPKASLWICALLSFMRYYRLAGAVRGFQFTVDSWQMRRLFNRFSNCGLSHRQA